MTARSPLSSSSTPWSNARRTPDVEQPYRELGLKDDEYLRIREILGRRPTDAELAMYSVMWSEHCSYKSSKVHLRLLRADHHRRRCGRRCWPASARTPAWSTSARAGRSPSRWRSHNHPSYVEPYQGAATGVGGIVRDIMAMGARPVAVIGPAALRPGRRPRHQRRWCPASSPASAVTATAWGCRTSAARWSSTPVLRRQPAGQRRLHRRAARRGHAPRTPPAPATRSSCSARAPAWTASAACRCWPSTPSPATRCRRRPQQAAQRPGGRPVRREGADRVQPGAVRARPGGRHPGPRRRRTVLRHFGARRGRGRRHAHLAGPACRCAPRDDAGRDAVVASRRNACVRSSRPTRWTRSWRCAASGRSRRRHRRGDRGGPAGHHLPRRGRGRRAAAHRRPRGPGLPAADRAAGRPGRAAGQHVPTSLPRPRPRRTCARDCCCG